MRIALWVSIPALALAACGGGQPVSPNGTVTDANYSPPWVQQMPGTTHCSGTPPICFTTPGVPIMHQEEWRLEVTDLHNHDWVGTVEVDQLVYQRCNLDELWPKCSEGDTGDVRVEDRR